MADGDAEKMNFVEIFPKELSEKIFTFLSPEGLATASKCCRQWRQRINQDPLWLHHCMSRGWLKFGLTIDLLHEESFAAGSTNVSGTSPYYSLTLAEDTELSPLCKWRQVYMRALHLSLNWAKGRYIVAPILRGFKQRVSTLDCSNKYIVSGSEDRSLKVWDARTLKLLQNWDVHSDSVTCVKVKGHIIVSGCEDSTIRVFDAQSGLLKTTLQGHNGCVNHIEFDGETVYSTGADRALNVWSLRQAKLLHTLKNHVDEIECLSVYGSMAVTGSWDNSLVLWDALKGKLMYSLEGHTEVINCVQFDEDRIVSGSADATLRIWSTFTGGLMYVLEGHKGEVYCLVYNKRVIASGSSDSTVILWSLRGKQLHVLRAHLGVVRCLYIDNDKLVSGGDQQKIVVWDYRTGAQLNMVHRNPSLLHLMWISDTKLITASPQTPGTITVLSYW